MSSIIISRYLANELIRIGSDISIVEPLLPEAIKEMVEKIGYQNTLQIVAKIGGTTLLVAMPNGGHKEKSVNARTKMDMALGSEELGSLFRKHYGGETINPAIQYLKSCRIGDFGVPEVRANSLGL